MENKTITMHPLTEDGSAIDPSINLYPKTLASNILKDDGSTKPIQEPISVSDGTTSGEFFRKTSENNILLDINAIKKVIIESVYPIGCIYTSYEDVENPNEALDPDGSLGISMSWEAIRGTFLVASGENTSTGLNLTLGDVGGSKDAIVVSHNHGGYTQNTTVSVQSKTQKFTLDCRRLEGNQYVVELKNPEGLTIETTEYAPEIAALDYHGDHWMGRYNINLSHNHSLVNGTHNHVINSAGSDGTDKNMPPYLAVKMWRRTA